MRKRATARCATCTPACCSRDASLRAHSHRKQKLTDRKFISRFGVLFENYVLSCYW